MRFITFNHQKLSKLALGTVQFGLDYGIANSDGKPSQESVNEIIDYVSSQQLNCFDTAQVYGDSEEVLGSSLKHKRDVFLISKFTSDAFKYDVSKNIENSLNNLNTQTLYALLLHDCDLLYDWKQEYSVKIVSLISNKKIEYFGVSIYSSEDFEIALNNDSIKFIQIPFNLFDQRALSEDWFRKAKEKNKLLFIRSVFLQGLLLMKIENVPEKLEISKKYLRQLDSICKDLDMTRNELALSYVDSVAQDSLILFGCDNLSQAKQNIENYNSLKKLNAKIISRINKIFKEIDEKIYNPSKW